MNRQTASPPFSLASALSLVSALALLVGCGDAPADVPEDAPLDVASDTPSDTPLDIPADIPADLDVVCDAGMEWNGEECVSYDACAAYAPVEFTKPDGDSGDAAEQDCITESVCIARGVNGPLFNAVTEDAAVPGGCATTSPAGTRWAAGSCVTGPRDFQTSFPAATGCSPRSAIGATLCLHVVAEDLYFDVLFSSYSGGDSGGGFAYTRTLVEGGPCGLGAVCQTDDFGAAVCTCPDGMVGNGTDGCVADEG